MRMENGEGEEDGEKSRGWENKGSKMLRKREGKVAKKQTIPRDACKEEKGVGGGRKRNDYGKAQPEKKRWVLWERSQQP